MAAVRITSNIMPWATGKERKLDLATLQMVTDIDRVAKLLAPKASRALVNSSVILHKGLGHYAVRFGGGSVPYARRRHFENKKNPGTLRYLERAGDGAKRNANRYFKGI